MFFPSGANSNDHLFGGCLDRMWKKPRFYGMFLGKMMKTHENTRVMFLKNGDL